MFFFYSTRPFWPFSLSTEIQIQIPKNGQQFTQIHFLKRSTFNRITNCPAARQSDVWKKPERDTRIKKKKKSIPRLFPSVIHNTSCLLLITAETLGTSLPLPIPPKPLRVTLPLAFKWGKTKFRVQWSELTWYVPSPYVILNDFGGAFSMGAIGGGIWHGIKGARNSPRVCFKSASLAAHLQYWSCSTFLFQLFVTWSTIPSSRPLELSTRHCSFTPPNPKKFSTNTGRASRRIPLCYQSACSRSWW